jgi:hypothetical protein
MFTLGMQHILSRSGYWELSDPITGIDLNKKIVKEKGLSRRRDPIRLIYRIV